MYSPQKSAEIAGVSRKTVMDAINAQKLNARNKKEARGAKKENGRD